MNQKLARRFGEVLRKFRTDRNLSQEQLALSVGLDRTFVSMLERGVRQPTLETIFRLCKELETKPSEMIRRVE